MTLGDRLADRRRRWTASAVATAQQHRVLWPAAAIVLIGLVAYNLTLGSLFDYLRLETPLAYLPLLPLFSIGIALMTAQRYRYARVIRDRQIDFLIGIPMLVAAIVLITVVPTLASTYYWSNRPDVLSLALFVSGLVVLFYGVTWFWRLKASLIFLVLMWPALYLNIMPGIMQSFTDTTNNALASVVHHLPIGVTLSGQAGILLVHQASGTPLAVSVGTACSGADSVLGFLLIGGALLTAVGGGLPRKLIWMAVGLGLTFVVNLLRLTSILALASAGHPDLALGGYHAVIGLILFAVVVAVMMRLLPVFGLHARPAVDASAAKARPISMARPIRPTLPENLRRRRVTLGLLAVLTAFVALSDHGLGPYAAFQDGTGSPNVLPFGPNSAPAGFRVSYQATYSWATQYFGANSTFQRYIVSGGQPKLTSQPVGARTYNSVVYADVVRTDDRGSLDAYNLQNCFLFHNYNIVATQRVDIGNGVTALLMNYSDPATQARWATVSWAWPVDNKGETYYERIALTSSLYTSGADADVSPSGGLHGFFINLLNLLSGSHDDPHTDTLYKNADSTLRAQAVALVDQAVNHPKK